MKTDVKVIQPIGLFDGTKAPQFQQQISDSVQNDVKIIVIDLKDVTFMDSSGLGALVLSLKRVRAAGAKLLLCSTNEQIAMLFKLTSMDRVFEIFSSREELEQKLLHH
ncbi:MAG: STAS domain-containing protein [Cyanobacteria bacterium P01_G01_bin.49]